MIPCSPPVHGRGEAELEALALLPLFVLSMPLCKIIRRLMLDKT